MSVGGRAITAADRSSEAWDASHGRMVHTLRDLIRIRSINPPDPPGGELDVARYIAAALDDVGLPSEIHEPVPGRGSVTARLRGDGTGGEPLLLLAHVDVVPAPLDGWTHDPFAAEVADGWIYGRGAVDMKNQLAMEIEVVRLLAEEARAAGRDPAADPIPGLTRDVLFAATADEEAGGFVGAMHLAIERPETLRAVAAISEAGAVAVHVGARRLYPIMVAEKGTTVWRLTFHGTWGHGSQPRPDNAVLLAAEAARRLAEPAPTRLTPVTQRFLEGAIEATTGEARGLLQAIVGGDPRASGHALAGVCSPVYARALDAMLRDTISPNVLNAGVKFNVIPGLAELQLDMRRLPGTSVDDGEAMIRERLGPELAAVTDIELVIGTDAVVADPDGPDGLFPVLAEAVRAHDPDGVPLPVMSPFATDAKHLLLVDTPSYGFSPLRQPKGETYLDRYHGVDERVSIDGLRWGLPVMYDAVRRFCGPR